jgi:hypothetical protein
VKKKSAPLAAELWRQRNPPNFQVIGVRARAAPVTCQLDPHHQILGDTHCHARSPLDRLKHPRDCAAAGDCRNREFRPSNPMPALKDPEANASPHPRCEKQERVVSALLARLMSRQKPLHPNHRSGNRRFMMSVASEEILFTRLGGAVTQTMRGSIDFPASTQLWKCPYVESCRYRFSSRSLRGDDGEHRVLGEICGLPHDALVESHRDI